MTNRPRHRTNHLHRVVVLRVLLDDLEGLRKRARSQLADNGVYPSPATRKNTFVADHVSLYAQEVTDRVVSLAVVIVRPVGTLVAI